MEENLVQMSALRIQKYVLDAKDFKSMMSKKVDPLYFERKRLTIIDCLRPKDSDKTVTRCADELLAQMVEDGVNEEDRPSMYQIKKVIGEMRKKRKSNESN